MEMKNERESMKQLKDVFHEHHQPLVFNKEPWDQSKFTRCSACKNPLSGESYNCAECDEFYLHKRCAEAPFEINHLHRKHDHLTLQSSIIERRLDCCLLCKKKDDKFGYKCSYCGEIVHIECALLTLEHGHEILHDCHEHPLLLVENHNVEFPKNNCNFCDCPLFGSRYVCSTCKFSAHRKCTELPVEISHPCHRSALFLNKNEKQVFYTCESCKETRRGYFYSCSSCNFQIDCSCVWPRAVVEDKNHHEHPFNLFWKRDPFVCNACGSEGRYVSHVCVQCHLQVHQDCTLLPRYIKFLMHRHPLSHKYFLENMEHQKLDCRLCHEEVKTEHGSYSCLKQDCDYVIHVKCVTLDTDIYEVIDPNEIEDLLKDEPVESCITCVIERNESGEAIKIKHLFHEHELMLMEDKIKEEDVDDDDDHKQCNGCTGSISTSFYYCSRYPQCNFLLHKSCAELPRTWDGWLLSYPFTLRSEGIFKCYPCGQQCSGFFYKYYEEEYSLVLCLRCAKISDTFEYPGHQHFLFYDIQNELGWEGKCTACGSESRGERPFFTCKHDDVALEYKCMTLPHATRHKCDKHLLQLMYRDQSDDPIQHDCDICEEGRDPNHWFYHCSICDNSVHPRCVLGEYPFIKIGSMYEHKDHPHPLTFVQKIYYYPKCAICGDHCLDLSLECASCNYIVHWKCISRSRS